MSKVSTRSEVACINGAPSTPGYLMALLRELLHVPRGLAEIAEAKQVRKKNQTGTLDEFKIGSETGSSPSILRSRGFLFQGLQVHP